MATSSTSNPLARRFRYRPKPPQTAFPHLAMTAMRPAVATTDSTRIPFDDPALGADTQRAVFVDPYTGRVIGDEPVWFGYLPLSTWLDGLHRHLHLGEPGRVYSELAALWVVALGGTYLWIVNAYVLRRDRVGRLFRVDRNVAGRARTLNCMARWGFGSWGCCCFCRPPASPGRGMRPSHSAHG